jgi:glycosyltransferase involved in cell wall biosynthesis
VAKDRPGSTPPEASAAIIFEPDGYVLSGPKLMGRQAAGHSFLRAAVDRAKGRDLWCCTPSRQSAEVFKQVVLDLDPTVAPRWCNPGQFDILKTVGAIYYPGPNINDAARLRLRAGADAYSLCGVTHTTASHLAMDSIADLLTAPVMPWDALICTSKAVVETVNTLLEAERSYLQWRLNAPVKVDLPQLPVIPLGVHCQDFNFEEAERAAAREALNVADDEIVALFVGRLSFHAKAHPHPMYAALQEAAKRSGRRVCLIMCGWFSSENAEQAFREGATQVCPDVRCIFTNGKKEADRKQSWVAADVFVSLSDNIQETFGLTPLEAMAAGLPVIVTDWDGYKETVRDGIDGFRIATWMPAAGAGQQIAKAYEAATINYDTYCGLSCQTISLDVDTLTARLCDLIVDPALRRRLGDAGRKRARETFDWSVIYKQYEDLWVELERIRHAAPAFASVKTMLAEAPNAAASRMDPFRSFSHYPSKTINFNTKVELRPGATFEAYRSVAVMKYYKPMEKMHPRPELAQAIFEALKNAPKQHGAMTVGKLASEVRKRNNIEVVLAVATLSKMNMIDLG